MTTFLVTILFVALALVLFVGGAILAGVGLVKDLREHGVLLEDGKWYLERGTVERLKRRGDGGCGPLEL